VPIARPGRGRAINFSSFILTTSHSPLVYSEPQTATIPFRIRTYKKRGGGALTTQKSDERFLSHLRELPGFTASTVLERTGPRAN
jgi:hypothetical protein